jgi:probable F420-dependent oxidoreductase
VSSSPRSFRFGVSSKGAVDAAAWRALARRAEQLGYSTLVVADHLAEMFPPLVALAAASEATTELRLGTFVVNNDFRHPARLARDAATLDLLTGGRFELGMGAGHMKSEYDEIGLRFDPGGVRVDRLVESVGILRALLAGDEVTHRGTHYQLDAHRCFPVPAGPVPLLIGGNGTRVLQLAAARADIVGFTGFGHRADAADVRLTHFTAPGLADRVEVVRREAGDRFDDLELNLLVQAVVVTDDRRAAAERMRTRVGGLPIDAVLDSPFLLLGSVEQITEQVQGLRERFGVSYLVVFEPAMHELAPVVERLAGR